MLFKSTAVVALCCLVSSCGPDVGVLAGDWQVSRVRTTEGESVIADIDLEGYGATWRFTRQGGLENTTNGNSGVFTVKNGQLELSWKHSGEVTRYTFELEDGGNVLALSGDIEHKGVPRHRQRWLRRAQ